MGEMPKNRLEAYMPMGDLEGKRDFSFQDIRGFQILNTTGHKVGTVKDVFVDPNTLEPHFAYLHYEKLLNRNVKNFLVPWSELRIGQDYVQTQWSEDQLLPQTQAEQQANLAAHGGAARVAGGSQTLGTSGGAGIDSAANGPSRFMERDDNAETYEPTDGDQEAVRASR